MEGVRKPKWGERVYMYLCLLHRALLQNLLHDSFLFVRAELVLENAVRGAVEDALAALPVHTNTLASRIPPPHCNNLAKFAVSIE